MKKLFLLFILSITGLSISARPSSPEYLALSDSADNFIKKERWADAEQSILKALRLEPGNFSNSLLLSNLGVIHSNMGHYDKALEDFRLGLSIAPKSTVLRNNRARTLLAMRRYDDALTDLNESLAADSLQQPLLQLRGNLLLRKGRTDEAEKDFNLALKLYPRSEAALTGLARTAEIKGDAASALSLYQKALDIEKVPETLFSYILLNINSRNYSQAALVINDAIKRFPEIGDFYLLRGYLHKLNFRNDEALVDKKIAIDKGSDPQFVEQFLPAPR